MNDIIQSEQVENLIIIIRIRLDSTNLIFCLASGKTIVNFVAPQ
jgi:hypothetical protein